MERFVTIMADQAPGTLWDTATTSTRAMAEYEERKVRVLERSGTLSSLAEALGGVIGPEGK